MNYETQLFNMLISTLNSAKIIHENQIINNYDDLLRYENTFTETIVELGNLKNLIIDENLKRLNNKN